ncbi:hypothetical protein [Paracidovorax konjaci]|uniref:Uncharacterized protein n=1 Tax=Paracidovorax konjaci TaxID=32040 RepID=A0A1I1UQN3_9BURK|nr:hypothetical protein [Paracidovorax konjaci]SFD73142.1 hypothetical protein SAMN04489710_105227 [Paracidovorax konjaci]
MKTGLGELHGRRSTSEKAERTPGASQGTSGAQPRSSTAASAHPQLARRVASGQQEGSAAHRPRTQAIARAPVKAEPLRTTGEGASASSSQPKAAKTSRINAALIAQALSMMADNPLHSAREVIRDIGRATLGDHIGKGGICRKPELLQTMPDYEDHKPSILASLRRLHQTEQADWLEKGMPGSGKRPLPDGGTADPPAAKKARASRQPIHPEQIFQAMSDRLASGRNLHGKNMEKWSNPEKWQQEKLATRLAKHEDYPLWRDRIEPLARRLGLIGAQENLPPGSARETFDAAKLVAALRLISQRTEAKASQRLDAPCLREALHDGVGVKKGLLYNWISAEGVLRKPPKSIEGLPGYEQHGPEIRELLTALGQQEFVAALDSGAPGLSPISARKVAKVLEMMCATSPRTQSEIAQQQELPLTTLTQYVRKDGLNIDRLQRLADYGAHAGAIRAWAQRLGWKDQAAALPEPAGPSLPPATTGSSRMEAALFLKQAPGYLDNVERVARMLRDAPATAIQAAADAQGAPRRIVRALLDERGRVRDLSGIGQLLSGVDGAASARIAGLLARLSARLDPPPDAGPPQDSRVKMLRQKVGGTAPDRILLVDRHTRDPGQGAPDRLGSIYRQNSALVHPPRSYAQDRHAQPLRWLSTLLRQQFPETDSEIQCYYDAGSGSIIVSSNETGFNTTLRTFLAGEGMQALLAQSPPPAPIDNTQRALRHEAKLLARLDPASDPHPTPVSDEIFAAIAEQRFAVPDSNYQKDSRAVHLHAERRIADHLRDELDTPLDHTMLAGTMRPCGTCADELEVSPSTHRGPFWMSKSSRAYVEGQSDIHRQMRANIGSSITQARNGRLTFNHDTDSDSDG